jgi:MFS family permease
MSGSDYDEKAASQPNAQVTARDDAVLEAANPVDESVVRRLIRKTDLLVMPGLCLAYFTNVLDRSNLGNAKTDTIEEDLNLKANEFSTLLIVFYIPYALFNIPWSLLSKKYNPAIIIPLAVCLWGIATSAAVASKNVGHLMACRFIIGAVEASYKPCEVFYLSLFYTRKEMSFRVGMIGQFGFIAGAVSGLISWGVFQWNGSLRVSRPSLLTRLSSSLLVQQLLTVY